MDFFIRKGATLPNLELELVQDGMHDKNEFYDRIQNAEVRFSMQNVESCINTVICRPMIIQDCVQKCNNCAPEYKLIYKWRARDTRKKGRFEGKIEIDFYDGCGKLIAPIHEKLYINVI